MNRTYTNKKTTALLLAVVLLISLLTGCTSAGANAKDIVVLYTNDVNCAIDKNIGYAGLAAYKKAALEKTPYVTLVDCGDALQGGAIGMLSQGWYLVDIMNEAGYDFTVLGNNEFGYGMNRLAELLERSKAQYLGCNISYSGGGTNALSKLKPYEIVSYGETKVAFIGVSTPESITKSIPAYFMDESGRYVYDFCGKDSGASLYTAVQETADQCRKEGANYVIVLAHLGVDEESAPYRSTDLIAGTSGIDAVLDGHSRSVIPCEIVENKEGGEVLLSSTGAELSSIGQLVITPSGGLSTGLITAYTKKDSQAQAMIQKIQDCYEDDLARVVAHSEIALTTQTEQGLRLIRSRETNLGDFCADAYRTVSGADIALVNAGGIRADLPADEITYGDLIAVHPYGNTLCVVEATGQEILDALEIGSRATRPVTSDGKNAVGESGGFLQVSGLRYCIDTAVQSTVVLDEQGMFVSCGDARRVRDVEVMGADGAFSPLEPNKTYSVASNNYLIKQGGDGINLFMDNPLLLCEGMPDYQILITYMTESLDGLVNDSYAEPQNRITVK